VKCEDHPVTDFAEQRRHVRQVCILSPYFLIVSADYIIYRISKGSEPSPIPRLLFADD
jgi:hypothetical protein